MHGELWAGTNLGLLTLGSDGAVLYLNGDPDPDLADLLPYVSLRALPESLRVPEPWVHAFSPSSTGMNLSGFRPVPTADYHHVVDLAPDGPAARAGIRIGDKVLSLPMQFSSAVGDTVTMRIWQKASGDTMIVALPLVALSGQRTVVPIVDILEAPEGAWIGTMAGSILFIPSAGFASQEARRFDLGRLWPRLAQTPDGTVWVGGNASGQQFYQIRPDSVMLSPVELDMADGLKSIMPSLLVTRDGTLWVGHHVGRLRARRDGRWLAYSPSQGGLPTSLVRVTDLLEAADGSLWLVQSGRAALRLDRSQRYTTYADLAVIPEVGSDGTVWFDAENPRVIVRYRDGSWQELLNQGVSVDAVSIDWLRATPSGQLGLHDTQDPTALTIYDTDAWHHHRDSGLGGMGPYLFESRDGSLWTTANHDETDPTRSGVSRLVAGQRRRYREQQWRHYREKAVPRAAYGMAQTPDGDMWFSGSRLLRFDGTTWHVIADPPELAQPFTQSVRVDAEGICGSRPAPTASSGGMMIVGATSASPMVCPTTR